jgi:transcriptional regulator with XRE-family HTH domain
MVTKKDKTLAKNIKRLRKSAKLKQYQLAEKVGVSDKYIQYIESAKRIPSMKTLYKIANALGKKVKDFFSF